MLIGKLSKRTGLTKDTIRFYEKMELITAGVGKASPVENRQAGTRFYKEFSEETVQQLQTIDRAKSLGFTLNEIKQLTQEWGTQSAIPECEQIRIVEHKLEEISQKMNRLAEIQADLRSKLRQLVN